MLYGFSFGPRFQFEEGILEIVGEFPLLKNYFVSKLKSNEYYMESVKAHQCPPPPVHRPGKGLTTPV